MLRYRKICRRNCRCHFQDAIGSRNQTKITQKVSESARVCPILFSFFSISRAEIDTDTFRGEILTKELKECFYFGLCDASETIKALFTIKVPKEHFRS